MFCRKGSIIMARYCDGDGWHQTHGLCVYVEGGLVRRYYRADDKSVTVIEMDEPCMLNTLKVRLYRQKQKDKTKGR